MRNATCMVDYREVMHGYDLIRKLLGQKKNIDGFTSAVDDCFPGISIKLFDMFNGWWERIRTDTYITSISAHHANENQHGRLSMWRAFGGTAGRVALVLDVPWYSGAAQALGFMLSPVGYMTEDDAQSELSAVIDNIRREKVFLVSNTEQNMLTYLFYMLVSAVTFNEASSVRGRTRMEGNLYP